MREFRTYGSVGGLGGQPPRSTRNPFLGELRAKWPFAGYGLMGTGDWASYRTERNEILDLVRRENLAGFATLAGDRHAFAAGLLSAALPPSPMAPDRLTEHLTEAPH